MDRSSALNRRTTRLAPLRSAEPLSPDASPTPRSNARAALPQVMPPRPQDVVLTEHGVAVVDLDDVFDEYIVELHWREVRAYLACGSREGLAEFAGVQVGGE